MTSHKNQEIDLFFKCLIIGDSATGKNSILLRFSDNLFNKNDLATIGVDFKIRTIQVNNMAVKLQVWEISGQELFRIIASSYYRGTDYIFVAYSSGNRKSFENVIFGLKILKNILWKCLK